jgi:hypothetical protein
MAQGMMRRRSQSSSSALPSDRTEVVPAVAVLDNWAHAQWTDGCQVDELPALQSLTVFTMNHLYEIIVISSREGRVRVRGGQFFPSWREVYLAGCSLGGSFLKLRGVYTGFCMELHVDGEVIVTSPVQKLTLSRPAEAPPH